MTGNEDQCRVTFSEEPLEVVRHVKETSFEHLLTGDESWFYYECPHDLAWVPSRATVPMRHIQENSDQKVLHFHYLVDARHPSSSCFACRTAV
jgi:hypothetical protein